MPTTGVAEADGATPPPALRAAAVRARIHELHRRHAAEPVDVVSYYPPEAEARRDVFGLSGVHVSGVSVSVGQSTERFPLQSISKVFTYALALEDNGRDATLARVGVEPSGDPYNSITFDEAHRRPHNPMINSGALVAAALVHGRTRAERIERLVARLRSFAGNPTIDVDPAILDQQLRATDRNLGLAYIMRSLRMLDGDVDDTLAVYLSACSVTVTTDELAVMGATLANGGLNPLTGDRAMPVAHVRDVLSVMLTCGMYDAAGQWFHDVGIPAKSGVSGGIVAALPGRLGIAVYSPGLDAHGNSVRGVNICRDLSDHFGLHVFAAERPDTAFA
ncbi:glutaminase A [Actinomycetospora cinnamomea]|uniref:Glutaminase n=1 Tax=Actinomycetospora cinnamomea TaxID=663609 RepID=A0A2U1EDJ4_9PSEU|nr:glutaminase A [Actinomycetospora cinnamomea]PVY97990.1 L-glutaminase [Actinomycetospora cinnamomea]